MRQSDKKPGAWERVRDLCGRCPAGAVLFAAGVVLVTVWAVWYFGGWAL